MEMKLRFVHIIGATTNEVMGQGEALHREYYAITTLGDDFVSY